MDGQQQRKALTAVERAIKALGVGDSETALRAAFTAAELDQIGAYSKLVEAVEVAVDRLDAGEEIDPAIWDELTEAVGPGPVAATIAELRAG